MYINPFWAGAVAAILTEIAFAVIAMIIFVGNSNKKK